MTLTLAELFNYQGKTNQFNFNCKRLTQSKLLNKTNNISYMINLVDDLSTWLYQLNKLCKN